MDSYKVNFGVITYGIVSHYTILIENYTNNKVELTLCQEQTKCKKGIYIKYEFGPLLPKTTRAIDILFQPTKKDYPHPVCIYTYFCIHVSNSLRRFFCKKLEIFRF